MLSYVTFKDMKCSASQNFHFSALLGYSAHSVCVLSQKWRKPRQSLSDEDLDAISCFYRTVSFSGCGGCEGENLDSVYRAAIIPDKSAPHPSFSNQDLLSTNIQTIYFLGALEYQKK